MGGVLQHKLNQKLVPETRGDNTVFKSAFNETSPHCRKQIETSCGIVLQCMELKYESAV